MKVLVIGSGGREHALAWKIAQSPLVKKVYCAPGNAGTANVAENIAISADNINALRQFATMTGIGLTIVGPEQPLVKGIVDSFEESGCVYCATIQGAQGKESGAYAALSHW